MKASNSASSPSSAAGVPNAMQVFQNAAAGQPAGGGPVTGSQIDDVMAGYLPLPDMTDSAGPSSPSSAADGLNAMQVFQNAAAGQPANDGPMIGGGFDDAMSPYPPLGDTVTAADMRDPASGQYPLAIQGLLGDGVSAQPYTDALSQLNFDPAPPQPDSSPSLSDAISAPDMLDPANDDYPLAIQGLLGDGLSAQPYTDALSELSLNTTPPEPDLHVVRPGETVLGIAHGDYAKMAAIVARNHLKLAADGSPILRASQPLAIPDISGLDRDSIARLDAAGRNFVAANTQGINAMLAQRATAQNLSLTPWGGAGPGHSATAFPSSAAGGGNVYANGDRIVARSPLQSFRDDLGEGYYFRRSDALETLEARDHLLDQVSAVNPWQENAKLQAVGAGLLGKAAIQAVTAPFSGALDTALSFARREGGSVSSGDRQDSDMLLGFVPLAASLFQPEFLFGEGASGGGALGVMR